MNAMTNRDIHASITGARVILRTSRCIIDNFIQTNILQQRSDHIILEKVQHLQLEENALQNKWC